MKIILVKCINMYELQDLMIALINNFKYMGMNPKINKRKKEIRVSDNIFRFVTVNQNIKGIIFDKMMNSYEFYKDKDGARNVRA